MSAAAKQTICRFVRLKATFVFIFDKSFGTGTYAIPKTSFPSKLYAVLGFIPHVSQPAVSCLAKSSIRGMSPIRAMIFPRYIRLFAVLLYGEIMN